MKRTIIDMVNRKEHHQISGRTYSIDRRLERRGTNLYLDRTFVQHPEIASFRSILMPSQHLWAIFFEGQREPYPLRCYIHMARIFDRVTTVVVEDLYLDVTVALDGRWQLLDVGEFREAVAAGELSPEQVQASLLGLENACRLVELAQGDVEAYLNQTLIT